MNRLAVGLLAWPVKHTDHTHASSAPRFLTAGTPVSVLTRGERWVLVLCDGVAFRVPVGFVSEGGK